MKNDMDLEWDYPPVTADAKCRHPVTSETCAGHRNTRWCHDCGAQWLMVRQPDNSWRTTQIHPIPVVDDPPLVMGDEKATGAALWCVYVVLAAVCVLCWLGALRMVGVVG